MLRTARVVATHPERRHVDLVFMDNNWRVSGVPVCGSVASDAGSWSVPSTSPPSSEATAAALSTSDRNLVAVVGFAGNRPLVMGFIHPHGGQMAFNQQGREVHRHSSGGYVTWAPDGSLEVFHPSGAFVRLGTGTAHEDLTPFSADGNWSIPGGAPAAELSVSVGGASLTIDGSGNVSLSTSGKLSASYGSAAFTGDMSLAGNLTVSGDVKAGNVSLEQHTHGGVQAGGANTAPPNH